MFWLCQHEATYKEIFTAAKGTDKERRLAPQFIVKYFKFFPNSAINALFDLAKDEKIEILNYYQRILIWKMFVAFYQQMRNKRHADEIEKKSRRMKLSESEDCVDKPILPEDMQPAIENPPPQAEQLQALQARVDQMELNLNNMQNQLQSNEIELNQMAHNLIATQAQFRNTQQQLATTQAELRITQQTSKSHY